MALAAFIISIIALVVAMLTLPTIFQMIWGRPRIMVRFDVIEVPDGRFLVASIFSYPIKNKLLRLLGVTRMAADDVNARVAIKERESQTLISDVVADIKTYTGLQDAQRICLPASIFPARIGIVEVKNAKRKVKVYEKKIILRAGSYCAFVEIIAAHKTIPAYGDFSVSDSPPFTYWDKNSLVSTFDQNLDVESAEHIS
jgi:hypothetical protein